MSSAAINKHSARLQDWSGAAAEGVGDAERDLMVFLLVLNLFGFDRVQWHADTEVRTGEDTIDDFDGTSVRLHEF